MRNNMKLGAELILLFMTFTYSFGIGMCFAETADTAYRYMFYHRSYIEDVNTPSYGSIYTIKLLLDFNKLADGGIVQSKGTRPIIIQEQSILMQLLYPNAIGITFPSRVNCNIFMRPGLDSGTYRETLLHEYLHCFGYLHSPDRNDLMYYADVPVDKEESIKYYAIDLKRKYYVYRFYRF